MKKIKKVLRTYPVIYGFMIIGVLVVVVLGKWYSRRSTILDTQVVTNDLEREQTVDEYTSPEEIVTYYFTALQQRDVDKAIRGCAIYERKVNMNLKEIIDEKDVFSNNVEIAASGTFSEYEPISSIELTVESVRQYQSALDYMEQFEKTKLEKVYFSNPVIQTTTEQHFQMKKAAACWGGVEICEMAAVFKADGQEYMMGFTVILYDKYWKIYSLGSELLGTTDRNPIRENDNTCYGTLSNAKYKEYVDKEKNKTVTKKIEWTEALLGPNYFLLNSAYETTPEKLIEEFTLRLNRKDVEAAMTYGSWSEEKEEYNLEKLEQQKDFAVQVKNLCYNLQGNNYGTEAKPITEIEKSSSEIVESLSIENLPYLELLKIVPVETNDKEYIAIYYYGKDRYIVGFTLEESKLGWKIKEISSDKAHLKMGEIKKITEKKAEELIKKGTY